MKRSILPFKGIELTWFCRCTKFKVAAGLRNEAGEQEFSINYCRLRLGLRAAIL